MIEPTARRLRHLMLALTCLLLIAHTATAQISQPKLTPTPTTEQQKQTIREGVALHDQGDYDGAIGKYAQVLKENPSSTLAIYELAYAYFAKQDLKSSLEVAYKGAQYKCEELPELYTLIGNILDIQGDPKGALKAYEAGIKVAPRNGMLYFNMAVTYSNLQKPDEAKKSLKKSATFNPTHPTTHLLLGATFYKQGYKPQALLAASRFLTLEPRSERAGGALKMVYEILQGGARQGSKPNEIDLMVSLAPNKDEGDFGGVEFILGISKAASMTEEGKNKSVIEGIVSQYNTAITSMAESKTKDKSFTWQYYAPYFIEMKQKNLVEPFCYYIFQATDVPGVREWTQQNRAKLDEFVRWSNAYRWKEVD